MKKLLFFLGIALILSGCEAQYVIEINDSNIKENLVINNFVDTSDMNIDFNNFYVPIDYEIDDYEFFTKKINNIDYYNINKENSLLELNYKFNIDNYSNSTLLNQCYENITFTVDDYELLLNASGNFLCFDKFKGFSRTKVTIKSDYKLLETNADNVEKNVYEWDITDSNKEIFLRLDSSYETNKKVLSFFEKNSFFFIFLLFVIIGGVVFVFVRKKSDLKNEL